MKITIEELSCMIGDIMREQREEPGLSTARKEKAYRLGKHSSSRRPVSRQLKKADRRQGDREIRWALIDADDDGDLDIVNMGPDTRTRIEKINSIGSQEMADARRAAGDEPSAQAEILGISVEDWHGIRRDLDDHYEDRHREDQAVDDIPEEDDWYADGFEESPLNESKESKMGNSFNRNDIKDWFAQTLYEDFETSKPRKRRSKGMLTEATSDDRKTAEPGGLDKLKNILVAGTLATHGIEIDQENKEAKALKAEFDNIIMAALEKYPDCVVRLSDHIGDFVDEARFDNDAGPDFNYDSVSSADGPTRDDMIDLIAGHVLDAKTDGGWTGIFDESAMMEFVTSMRDNGDIDIHDWNNHIIDAKEVRDRVAELEEVGR